MLHTLNVYATNKPQGFRECSNILGTDEPFNKQTKPRLKCDKWKGKSKVEISSKCKTNFGGQCVSVIFQIHSLWVLPAQTILDYRAIKAKGKIVLNIKALFGFENRLDKASFNNTSGINSYHLMVISSCIRDTALVYAATNSGI